MEIRQFLIMLLLFSAVIIGLSLFMTDLAGKYNQNVQDLRTFSQASSIENKTKEFEQTFRTKITGITLIDVPFIAIKGFVEFIDLVSTALFGFFDSFINSVAQYLFLPSWFVGIVSAIVMIIILFEIISTIIKWRV